MNENGHFPGYSKKKFTFRCPFQGLSGQYLYWDVLEPIRDLLIASGQKPNKEGTMAVRKMVWILIVTTMWGYSGSGGGAKDPTDSGADTEADTDTDTDADAGSDNLPPLAPRL